MPSDGWVALIGTEIILLFVIHQLNLAPLYGSLLFLSTGGFAALIIISFFAPLREETTLNSTRFAVYVRYQVQRLLWMGVYPSLGFGVASLLRFKLPWIAVLPIALSSLFVIYFYGRRRIPSYGDRASQAVRRGSLCRNYHEARAEALELNADIMHRTPSRLPPYQFGGVDHAPHYAQQGFLFLGNPGSGKSTAIETLLSTELPHILNGCDHRAIIYDAKGDMPPFLEALGFKLDQDYFILNPFDTRCTRWDIARDCVDDALAVQFASILVPEKETTNPFFDQGVRVIIASLMQSLMRIRGESWTWRDLINAASGGVGDILDVIDILPGKKESLQHYFADIKLCSSVLSTLTNYIDPYRVIASSWQKAKTSVSVRDFVKSRSVLLLGADYTCETQIGAINRLFFRHLVDTLRSYPDAPHDASRRTWLVIDETKEAGMLDALPTALSFGRSKGLCTVLGVQDKLGLRRVYGTERAEELTDLTRHIAVFNCGNATAQEAAKLFGMYETYEVSTNTSLSYNNTALSQSENTVKREVVLPAEISSLPDPKCSEGIHGFFHSPLIAAWRAVIPWSYIEAVRAKRIPGFPSQQETRITQERMTLTPWSEEEWNEFNSSRRSVAATTDKVKFITKRMILDKRQRKAMSE